MLTGPDVAIPVFLRDKLTGKPAPRRTPVGEAFAVAAANSRVAKHSTLLIRKKLSYPLNAIKENLTSKATSLSITNLYETLETAGGSLLLRTPLAERRKLQTCTIIVYEPPLSQEKSPKKRAFYAKDELF